MTASSSLAPGLQSDIAVVLQTLAGAGAVKCRAFGGIPVTSPAFIAVLSAGTPESDLQAHRLEEALGRTLLALGVRGAEVAPPCGGTVDKFLRCHANSVGACKKVLVAIADTSQAFANTPIVQEWIRRGSGYEVLPVMREGGDAATVLPVGVRHLNAAVWKKSVEESVDEVLGLAGIGTEDRRVFVSYRRVETTEVAEQLFDELSRYRFDVFVDRFRVPPGRDFQERLTDELAHKAMIVVLESNTILHSEWVGHELAFAKKHGLGRLAVALPGGVAVPWLDDEFRVSVRPEQLAPQATAVRKDSRLTPDCAAAVVSRIVSEHTRALSRRRASLMDSMRAALTYHGAVDQAMDARGHLHVRVQHSGVDREYALWASPRPPDLPDFYAAHQVCSPGPTISGLFVAPSSFLEEGRRRRFEWLAERSLLGLIDEGRIDDIAARIAAGKDLW